VEEKKGLILPSRGRKQDIKSKNDKLKTKNYKPSNPHCYPSKKGGK